MKIYAVSDIHIDFESNAKAIYELSEYDYRMIF